MVERVALYDDLVFAGSSRSQFYESAKTGSINDLLYILMKTANRWSAAEFSAADHVKVRSRVLNRLMWGENHLPNHSHIYSGTRVKHRLTFDEIYLSPVEVRTSN